MKCQYGFSDYNNTIMTLYICTILFSLDYLQHYAPRDVLSGDYLITEFRPDLIKQLLGYLTPQSSRVAVIGQKFKGQTSLKEPWYGSEYNIRKIDADVIEKWSQVEHDDKFYLPARNEFIPTDFTLVPPPPKDAPKLPVLIQVCTCTYILCPLLNLPVSAVINLLIITRYATIVKGVQASKPRALYITYNEQVSSENACTYTLALIWYTLQATNAVWMTVHYAWLCTNYCETK